MQFHRLSGRCSHVVGYKAKTPIAQMVNKQLQWRLYWVLFIYLLLFFTRKMKLCKILNIAINFTTSISRKCTSPSPRFRLYFYFHRMGNLTLTFWQGITCKFLKFYSPIEWDSGLHGWAAIMQLGSDMATIRLVHFLQQSAKNHSKGLLSH